MGKSFAEMYPAKRGPGEMIRIHVHPVGDGSDSAITQELGAVATGETYIIGTKRIPVINIEVTSIHDDPNHHDGQGRYVYGKIVDGDPNAFVSGFMQAVNPSGINTGYFNEGSAETTYIPESGPVQGPFHDIQ